MLRSGILIQTSREPIKATLVALVQNWVTEWYRQAVDIDVKFNDVLFACYEMQDTDTLVQISKGSLVLVNEAEVLSKLAARAIAYQTEFESLDAAFHEQLGNRVALSLINRFTGKEPVEELNKNLDFTAQFQSVVRVDVAFSSGDCVSLLLDETLVYSIAKTPKPVYDGKEKVLSRSSSIETERVKLNASLSAVALPLEDFIALKPGDVIQLPHMLSDSIHVTTRDGQLNLDAYLVKSENKRSLLIRNKEIL